jgi:hypothetical protein
MQNSAVPQLISAAISTGLLARFFRRAYQAKVMNRFDKCEQADGLCQHGQL